MDRFAPARRALDDQVAAGRFPGYVLATSAGGRDEVHAGGCDAVDGATPAPRRPVPHGLDQQGRRGRADPGAGRRRGARPRPARRRLRHAAPVPVAGRGLVSTAADLLRFATAVRDGGRAVLSPASVRRLTTDQLSPGQRASGGPVLDEGTSWTCGAGVVVAEGQPMGRPGTWGWAGGLGTHLWVDPVRDVAHVVLTQACFDATPGGGFAGFRRALADC